MPAGRPPRSGQPPCRQAATAATQPRPTDMTTDCRRLAAEATGLLRRLIATPSVSRDEKAAADLIEQFMEDSAMHPRREANNVWAVAPGHDDSRPTLLLNAHIDTVKPVASWTRDPFCPTVEGGRLYGLGSNDCGGGLVSLLATYAAMARAPRAYNLVCLASAEEEVSGADGISRALPLLPHIDVAIVGEPTGMQPAIAEKGLMVVDAVARGRSGHAARAEGVNAIYKAIDDIAWLRSHRFGRVSPLLGPTLATVTVIGAGTQHNVVPDECRFTIDVRSNELYTNAELLDELRAGMGSELTPRSTRLGSSAIDPAHPLVERCRAMGMVPFGSPTLSDQALMPFPSMKLGPGDSARSHSADEYIALDEIASAIETYTQLLDGLRL